MTIPRNLKQPTITLQIDIEREISNLRRSEKSPPKQKLKKSQKSSRTEKMKFSEGQRRIRLLKADNEGFGFVIKDWFTY